MSRLYQAPANMNKNEVCVLYAVAAAGSEYSNEEIPDHAKKEYFEHGSSVLKDAVKEDPLMGMRASAALGVCLVLRKSVSARSITGKRPEFCILSAAFTNRVQHLASILSDGICAGGCEMRASRTDWSLPESFGRWRSWSGESRTG